MTPEKVREVVDIYRKKFQNMGIDKKDHSHDEKLDMLDSGLEHCHGMLDKIDGFIEAGRIEKAFRWLGFIQGALWMDGRYSLSELKDHNRP